MPLHMQWIKKQQSDWTAVFLTERVVRKLNANSTTLDNLELREFNPPEIKLLDKLEFV